MDLTEGKIKSKEYYDQIAESYKNMYQDEYEKYPANLIRLKMLLKRLKETNSKTILDVGCGTCAPMIKLLKEGFLVTGCDFSHEMIKIGKSQLENEGFSSDLIFQADVEDDSTLPNEKFDAIFALGVFPHLVDESTSLTNLKKRLTPNGKLYIEFRNELFSLFSFNKYTIDFVVNKLLDFDSFPKNIQNDLVDFYTNMFQIEKPIENKSGKISYDEILARFRNPLTIENDLFKSNGLKIDNTHFYHFHALPPIFSEKHEEFFKQKSLEIEKSDDWRGNFLASAFVVEASILS